MELLLQVKVVEDYLSKQLQCPLSKSSLSDVLLKKINFATLRKINGRKFHNKKSRFDIILACVCFYYSIPSIHVLLQPNFRLLPLMKLKLR